MIIIFVLGEGPLSEVMPPEDRKVRLIRSRLRSSMYGKRPWIWVLEIKTVQNTLAGHQHQYHLRACLEKMQNLGPYPRPEGSEPAFQGDTLFPEKTG